MKLAVVIVVAVAVLGVAVASYVHYTWWAEHRFDQMIADAANRHGLDPALVKALIRVQAGFPRQANEGRHGLMLVPEGWIEAYLYRRDEMIADAAHRHGLDPALVKALIRVEADLPPEADQGRHGLMQVPEDKIEAYRATHLGRAWGFICPNRHLPNHDLRRTEQYRSSEAGKTCQAPGCGEPLAFEPLDPEMNLEIGCWTLGEMRNALRTAEPGLSPDELGRRMLVAYRYGLPRGAFSMTPEQERFVEDVARRRTEYQPAFAATHPGRAWRFICIHRHFHNHDSTKPEQYTSTDPKQTCKAPDCGQPLAPEPLDPEMNLEIGCWALSELQRLVRTSDRDLSPNELERRMLVAYRYGLPEGAFRVTAEQERFVTEVIRREIEYRPAFERLARRTRAGRGAERGAD